MSDEKEIKKEQAVTPGSTGNDEKGQDLDPDKVILEELKALDDEILANYMNANYFLTETENGLSYRKAEDAILAYNMSLSKLGRYAAKTQKLYNTFEIIGASLKSIAGNPNQVLASKRILGIYKQLENYKAFTDALSDMVQNQVFMYAYSMIRMDIEIPAIAADTYNRIIGGMNEYNTLRVKYGNADIIKELKLRKTAPPAENYDIAKYHLDNYIGGTKDLKYLLSSGGQNKLYIIDRLTCAFHHIYLKKDDLKGYLDLARKTLNTVNSIKESHAGLNIETYIPTQMQTITEDVIRILEKAIKLTEDYASNSSKLPYALMHYDFVVTEAANRWLGESLPDPLTNGTRYDNLIKSVVKAWDSVLRPIAKNAAKWGLD